MELVIVMEAQTNGQIQKESKTVHEIDESVLPNGRTNGETNGVTNGDTNGSSTAAPTEDASPKSGRTKIVVVGLGMVGIAFM